MVSLSMITEGVTEKVSIYEVTKFSLKLKVIFQ
jgi:hypothetical protein